MVDLPSGTVTFLFTDIEGSTRLWEDDAAAMWASLDRHNATLGAAVAANDGYHFKTMGDTFQVAFPTAGHAVAGATGTMPSAMIPEALGEIVQLWLGDDHEAATARWEHWLPMIHFENRQCGLQATKVLMKEGGIVASEATKAPFGPVRPPFAKAPSPTPIGAIRLSSAGRTPEPEGWACLCQR